MQTRGHSLGVFAEDTSAFFDDLHHTRIPSSCGSKDYGCQHRDFHFICRLHPANQFIKIVQRQRVQDVGSKLHLACMQIVFAQEQAERLHGKKITAASIAQDVSPPTRSLDSVAAASGHRGTASGVDHDAVSMIESGCQARVAVAARHDFGVWPYLETDLLERATIFLCSGTGKTNSSAINLLWQLSENCAQTFGRGKPEI